MEWAMICPFSIANTNLGHSCHAGKCMWWLNDEESACGGRCAVAAIGSFAKLIEDDMAEELDKSSETGDAGKGKNAYSLNELFLARSFTIAKRVLQLEFADKIDDRQP